MLAHVPDATIPATPLLRPPSLLVARIVPDDAPSDAVALVGDLDEATVARVRDALVGVRRRVAGGIAVTLQYVGAHRLPHLFAPLQAFPDVAVHTTLLATDYYAQGPDPFGLDPAYRAMWLPPLRVAFERYFRVTVSGIEHVPETGPAIVVANHSGAVPADAFMLALALELRDRGRRPLRMLYDRFVDSLPWIGGAYKRLGAVPASFANAERLLRRGELVGLFPEGIAGLEKRFTERYQLRPFRTGAARLCIRSRAPIVPVAIVGAEEAYPVIARLYRLGGVIGVPWIPLTPFFPWCGLPGALPLPTKWHIRFLPPVQPPAPGRSEDALVSDLGYRVREVIAGGLADLLRDRRGIFV